MIDYPMRRRIGLHEGVESLRFKQGKHLRERPHEESRNVVIFKLNCRDQTKFILRRKFFHNIEFSPFDIHLEKVDRTVNVARKRIHLNRVRINTATLVFSVVSNASAATGRRLVVNKKFCRALLLAERIGEYPHLVIPLICRDILLKHRPGGGVGFEAEDARTRRADLDIEERYADICSAVNGADRFLRRCEEVRSFKKNLGEEPFEENHRGEVEDVRPHQDAREVPVARRITLVPQVYEYEHACRLKTEQRSEPGEISDESEKFHFGPILSYFAGCYYGTMRVLKFLLTGTIGLSVNLGTFHTLYVLGVPYLAGSVGAFIVAMCVGFVLQKYWTFEEHTFGRAHTQFMLYVMLTLGNLGVNTLIVYVLVEYTGAHYLVAQTVGAGSVAFVSYFVYRRYIFAA